MIPGPAFSLKTAGEPTSFAISCDGGLVAAACRDNKLRVWSLPHGQIVHTIPLSGHQVDVTAMSGDGRWIMIGDHQGSVTIWNSSTGRVHMQLRYVHYASAAVFSRDGKMVAIAPGGLPVQIIDVGARQKRCELGHPVGGTNALSFSRDDTRVGTADADCAARIYDAANGKLLAGNDDNWLMQPSTLDFTGDGSQVVVGSIDRVTVYVDTKTGKVVRRMDRDAEPPMSLQFSPNTNYLAILFFKADNMLAAAPITVLDAESGRKKVEWMPPAVPLGVA